MTHEDTQHLTGGYRFGKTVRGQTCIELEGPVGFIESAYFPERGTLFFASAWFDGEKVDYLVRDTPDHWLYIGWSASAEYRMEGTWKRIADATNEVLQHFRKSTHENANLRGRWSLSNSSSMSGCSVAHELCSAAIDWWDAQGQPPSDPNKSPQIHDFCAVFPSLTARRMPGCSTWHVVYSTETAEWIFDAKKRWGFHAEIDVRDRISNSNMKRRLAYPWRKYRRTLGSARTSNHQESDIIGLTAVAALLEHGTEFPLIPALLSDLLSELSANDMNFTDFSRYSAVNAIASIANDDSSKISRLFIQNDVARWEYSHGQWRVGSRMPVSRDTEEIPPDHLWQAAQQLEADPYRDPRWRSDSSQAQRTWIISDIDSELSNDCIIRDVVRGTQNHEGTGWHLTGNRDLRWTWASIPELSHDHLLPRYQFDQHSYASTNCVEVDVSLAVLLEEFWTQVINHETEYSGFPTWSDFLEWVRDYA